MISSRSQIESRSFSSPRSSRAKVREILGEAGEATVLAEGEVEVVAPFFVIDEDEAVPVVGERFEEDPHRGERGFSSRARRW